MFLTVWLAAGAEINYSAQHHLNGHQVQGWRCSSLFIISVLKRFLKRSGEVEKALHAG
ncbi:MAG: hypothetical protein AB8W37_04450 [Arsenophonus endosymbiont of Dermacentor nuttalli]